MAPRPCSHFALVCVLRDLITRWQILIQVWTTPKTSQGRIRDLISQNTFRGGPWRMWLRSFSSVYRHVSCATLKDRLLCKRTRGDQNSIHYELHTVYYVFKWQTFVNTLSVLIIHWTRNSNIPRLPCKSCDFKGFCTMTHLNFFQMAPNSVTNFPFTPDVLKNIIYRKKNVKFL